MLEHEKNINTKDAILITGYTGVLGSALTKLLKELKYENITLLSSKECNLLDLNGTINFFTKARPKYVIHLAGYVNGIMGNIQNKGPAYFNNVYINTNTIEASRLANVKKIIAIGTVAAYPDPPPSLPIKEEMIWNGYPHSSEDSYAHAKRAMLAQLIAYKESYNIDYSYVICSNLYGPNDKFNIAYGHVVPSLIAKFYDAKQKGEKVIVWGDGSAERDFVYSEDAARALMMILHRYSGSINLATGNIYKIKDLVNILTECTGLPANQIEWDATKPNGQKIRVYDTTKLNALGFTPQYSLIQGIKNTYAWYEKNAKTARKD